MADELITQVQEFLDVDDTLEQDVVGQVRASDIPYPTQQLNGRWKIPGTTKEFETQRGADDARQRFGSHARQNDASLLMHGVSYNQYLGKGDEQETTDSKSNTDNRKLF